MDFAETDAFNTKQGFFTIEFGVESTLSKQTRMHERRLAYRRQPSGVGI